MTTLYTVGHGTLSAEGLVGLLTGAGVRGVVDVRSFPGSRRHPQFGREEMRRWLGSAGVSYAWLRELGGRRRPLSGSRHVALQNPAFRGYADHMGTDAFGAGVEELVALASRQPTAVACSESLWWRCHRRLLADHLALVRGVEVVHLMHDGRLAPHVPTQGVHLADDAVVYDLGATPPLLDG
jgi:uncharacterized protein (DUF488 family)